MNWYAVWTFIVALIEGDEIVASVLGPSNPGNAPLPFYLAGSRAFEVPSMTALFVSDTETELWAPFEMQFDLFLRSLEDVAKLEQALRRLLNQPLPIEVGDSVITAEFIEGQLLRGPEKDPYFRRILVFRFTPVRSRYHRPQPVGG